MIKLFILFFLIAMPTSIGVYNYLKAPIPQYKVGECSKDQIHEDVRKILKVKAYIYYYCKIVDNKCGKRYFMKIKDFDRIMIKAECKEKK